LTDLLQKKLNVQDANVEIRVVGEKDANAIALELKAALELEH
jgi:pyruvate kinase